MVKVLEMIALIYVMDVLPVKSLDTFDDKDPVRVCKTLTILCVRKDFECGVVCETEGTTRVFCCEVQYQLPPVYIEQEPQRHQTI